MTGLPPYRPGDRVAARVHGSPVLAAVIRRYSWVDVDGNDTADALVLAALGRRWLGHPIDDPLPKTHLAALDGVHWPERVTA